MTNSAGSEIDDVAATSFWVAYYRAKETERPDALFRDPLAQVLIGTRGKKISDSMGAISRYTEWAVLSRTVIIDRFIEKMVKNGVDTILNLGTGLDTRPYRMSLPENLNWIEVDYPKIIHHKTEALKNEKPKCRLTRFEVDLADNAKRKEFLDTVAPEAKKILVLTEGVLPYLTPDQVKALSNDLRSRKQILFWITEYFDARVFPYLRGSAINLKMQNAPFQFFPENWFGFFKDLGWVEKETRYTGEIAAEFHRDPPMPTWAKVILAVLPSYFKKRALAHSAKMSGYTILERA